MDKITELIKAMEVGWMLRTLKPGRVLDVGSQEATYIKKLLDENYELCRVDTRKIEPEGSEQCIQGDIMNLDRGFFHRFDNVVLLSTLEHIGLEIYGNKAMEKPKEYQRHVLQYCLNYLGYKGRLLCSLPYGSFENQGWQYIYDKGMVEELVKELNLVNIQYFTYDEEMKKYRWCGEKEVRMEGEVAGEHSLLSGVCLEVWNG